MNNLTVEQMADMADLNRMTMRYMSRPNGMIGDRRLLILIEDCCYRIDDNSVSAMMNGYERVFINRYGVRPR